jgi:hypothetical protein
MTATVKQPKYKSDSMCMKYKCMCDLELSLNKEKTHRNGKHQIRRSYHFVLLKEDSLRKNVVKFLFLFGIIDFRAL